VPHGSKSRTVAETISFARYAYVVARSTTSEPVSNLNVTMSLTDASANLGLVTLREKMPASAAVTTPMTSPTELKAARVPSDEAAAPPIITVILRLADVSPLLSCSAHGWCSCTRSDLLPDDDDEPKVRVPAFAHFSR